MTIQHGTTSLKIARDENVFVTENGEECNRPCGAACVQITTDPAELASGNLGYGGKH